MCVDAAQATRWVDGDDAVLAARHHLPVLISGPCDMAVKDAARELHAASFSRPAPLVTFRASGFFDEKIFFAAQWRALCEAGRDGSVLITGIEEMSCAAQLLLFESLAAVRPPRAPRLISGTTVSLMHHLATGEFSEELFYRLNVIHLRVQQEESTPARRY